MFFYIISALHLISDMDIISTFANFALLNKCWSKEKITAVT